MFKHYLKTAWRNLKVNKFYSILNISGLAVGLATGIMLLLWVQNEFSYDKFHKQYKNIYEVNAQFISNGAPVVYPLSPGPISEISKKIPEIKSLARSQELSGVISTQNKSKLFNGIKALYVDSTFLNIFDFGFVRGNKKSFLPNEHSIAITKETALKLFGTDDAVGKVMLYNKENFIVSSVMENFPENSSIQADVLIPMQRNGNWNGIDTDLGDFNYTSYVLLYPNANPNAVAKKLSRLFYKQKFDKYGSKAEGTDFLFQNIGDVHLIGSDGNKSDFRMTQIMLLVATLILLIASINYVNLSTARALTRLKEVSVRKIIGAAKWQLFIQFICETLLLFLCAIIIAIGLIVILMPLYNNISGKRLSFSLSDAHTWSVLFLVIAGTLLSSSIYPALLLSSFQPLATLRNKKAGRFNTAGFRKILVVLQFSISFILLAGTIVMARQMKYIRNKDLGYDRSYVFTVAFPGSAHDRINAIKNDLLQSGAVLSVSAAGEDISNVEGSTSDLDWQGKPANAGIMISQLSVDNDFISTMKLNFAEGAGFTGTPSDSAKYVLNETAIKQMGLKPPYVGQPITFHNKKGEIAGVLKDFNFQPLTSQIAPIILFTSWWHTILYVRTTGGNAQNAIKAAQKEFQKYASDTPFSYDFLDKTFESHYKAQQRTGTLFTTFAAIAIFISCLGLFGLATYTAQVKTKEIGIRKVLGASVGSIVQLISKDFLKLVIIAIIIATPVAYLLMNKWLGNFAYKTSIGIFTFIIAAVTVMLIAFGTIGFKAFKAARANPVKSLKTE